ncbi:MAG: hypothetical protein K1X88_24050 [Nannocystaceae bacterium]|nr:hypothetical protein [Nannocystaceae bacterium]
MTQPSPSPVLLTVRGTLAPRDLEAARTLHNDTAGSAQGIAAARSLGDLSHKAYAPLPLEGISRAKAGELLFIDTWLTPEGIGQFFGNPEIGKSAGAMFTARDATVWMPARGAFTYHLPAPMAKTERYVGMIRGPVASPEAAIEIFAAAVRRAQPDARRRGHLSHELYVKLPLPGTQGPLELLGVDRWCSLEGLREHYTDASAMSGFGGAFSGPAEPTVWQQAPGAWNEW